MTDYLHTIAMQTAAAQACQNEIDHCVKQSGDDKSIRMGAAEDLQEAILALPGPTFHPPYPPRWNCRRCGL